MFGSVGNQCGVGAPLGNNQIGGENFIRHTGNDKLIFDFKEGSGTTVRDKSREGNDGTFGAGAAAPTWKRNSLYFDGGDYFYCADDDSLNPSDKLTIVAVVYITENVSAIFVGKEAAANNRAYYLRQSFLPVYHVDFVSSVDGTNFDTYSSVATLNINNWNVVIGVYNSGAVDIYNNAALISGAGDIAASLHNNTSRLDIGVRRSEGTPAGYFTGYMSSVRILNKGLSGIEAQREYLCQKFRGNN